MRPLRRLADDVKLFRPWLTVEKAAILAYMNAYDLGFRTDSSNRDQRLTRNRLRHDLLPKLQAEYNGRIQHGLAGLAEHAAHACRLLDNRAKKTLAGAEKQRVENLLIFDLAALKRLSLPSLQTLYAFIWRRERAGPRRYMGSREWMSLARWTLGSSSALDLPDGIRSGEKPQRGPDWAMRVK